MNKKLNKKAKARRAMTLAWAFVREAGLPLGEAMHRAYMNIRLSAMLAKGKVHFFYIKADGTMREAFGLAAKVGQYLVKGTGHETPSRNQLYFDIGANDFRCFCKARLVGIDA